ncbi:DMT family transporter [Streptomyces sp. URMC 127]|uniref:DMT family transporter n=1 Tax=Streptomyces sp. URMC 127 TaxID=3423402 RepID=UPI003F1CB97F
MDALLLPALLCLVSAMAYAGAAVVQERVAAGPAGAPGLRGPLRRPAWWGAVALTGLGAALHVAALAYGPLSLVQPLGALAIVFALPMAAVRARRPVGTAGWRGALLATAGLAGLLALTGPPRGETLGAGERPLLAAAALAGAAALALGARRARRAVVRGVVLAAAAGAVFGMASVLTKAAAQDWTSHRTGSLLPTLLATAVLASAGMLLSQASYRGAGLAAPLATLTIVNPVVAAAAGTAVLGETFRHGVPGGVLAALAGAVATAGVVTLTRVAPDRGPTMPAEAVPGARTGACCAGTAGIRRGG